MFTRETLRALELNQVIWGIDPSDATQEAGKVQIRPLKDRIVAHRIGEGERKVGGLVIPDTAKGKPMTAKVVAVGTGLVLENGTRVPLEVEKGSKVLIGPYAGSEVKLDDVEYLILREDDVLGIVE